MAIHSTTDRGLYQRRESPRTTDKNRRYSVKDRASVASFRAHRHVERTFRRCVRCANGAFHGLREIRPTLILRRCARAVAAAPRRDTKNSDAKSSEDFYFVASSRRARERAKFLRELSRRSDSYPLSHRLCLLRAPRGVSAIASSQCSNSKRHRLERARAISTTADTVDSDSALTAQSEGARFGVLDAEFSVF